MLAHRRRSTRAACKRALDLAGASALLVCLSPVLLVCGGLVRLVDGPPVLFRQERVGRRGRTFQLYKLRTMRPQAGGPLVTAAGDPRLTRLGRWLRSRKLDELPQLVNVLRGDMSLVGPRPEVPLYVGRQPHGFRAIADLRPGLTDWASLAFLDEEGVLAAHGGEPDFYPDVLLPRKLALARLYRRRQTLSLDLRIVVATAAAAAGWRSMAVRLAGPRLVARARRGLGLSQAAEQVGPKQREG
ncbi:MAG TPA: sugar transferase [Gemmatimonadales bacterium]|nr:sugar transferase [Gemmatimonadales bacterium]